MNRIIITLLVGFLVLINSEESFSQCKQQLVYSCATQPKTAGENPIYLRDFNAKLRKPKGDDEDVARFQVVLNKGTRYRFNLCNPEESEGKTVLTLFDATRPDNEKPIGKGGPYGRTCGDDGKDYPNASFDFQCERSGVYYVSIKFKKGQGDKKSCAVGILSFIGKGK